MDDTLWAATGLKEMYYAIKAVRTRLSVTFPPNVEYLSSSFAPDIADASARHYEWVIDNAGVSGFSLRADVRIDDLLLGESRQVTGAASISYMNPYTQRTLSASLPAPVILGIGPASPDPQVSSHPPRPGTSAVPCPSRGP